MHSQWNEWESAPTDGTPFLVLDENGKCCLGYYLIYLERFQITDVFSFQFSLPNSEGKKYWHPLPMPPQGNIR